MIDMAAIRARCEAATPGPWTQGDGTDTALHAVIGPDACCRRGIPLVACAGLHSSETATFLAHARADVPALCDEIDRLRAQLGTAQTPALVRRGWVNPDGTTRLPDKMMAGLGVEGGGFVYFLEGPPGEWHAAGPAALATILTEDPPPEPDR